MQTRAKVILYLSIVMFVLSLSTVLSAQNWKGVKGVQLNDGTMIHGQIIKANPDQVIIKKEDGNRVLVKFNDVSTFLKGELTAESASVLPGKTTVVSPALKGEQPEKPANELTGKTTVIAVASKDEQPAESANDLSGKAEGSSSFTLGIGYRYFDYNEDVPAPYKSTDNGWLPEVYLDYTFKKKSVFYTKVLFNYASGSITYDGTTGTGTPVEYSSHRAEMIKFELNVGYPISLTKNFTLIPYTGYSFRHWRRGEMKQYSPSAFFIKEVYQWHSIPIGLKADYDINKRWNIGGTAVVNLMFSGMMTAYDSEFLPGAPDIDFNLGNKLGFYADIPITYKFTDNWALVVTPWYEYGAFGQSGHQYFTYGGSTYDAYEPSSTTSQYGIKLGARFTF